MEKNKYEDALEKIAINNEFEDYSEEEIADAIDILRELVEKSIPKKPYGAYYSNMKCPACGRRVRSGQGSSQKVADTVCRHCFQRLKWED